MLYNKDILNNINYYLNITLIIFFFIFILYLIIKTKEYVDKNLSWTGNSIVSALSYYFVMWCCYLDELWPIYEKYIIKYNLYFNIQYFDKFGIYIILVCLLSLIFCFFIVDNKIFLNNKSYYYYLFFYFFIILLFFVFTNNIFIFFICYELMMLPSILILFYTSANIRVNFIASYFIIWTGAGSLILLLIFSYFYYYNIIYFTDFSNFNNFEISTKYIIVLFLFIGFGIKIPIYPFYFWLVRTHVEANTSFSIFLSGFLVKIALYGFYKVYFNLNYFELNNFFLFIIFLGIIDSSIKMLNQIDIKKIVALMTVQEMNMILSFFFLDINKTFYIAGIFCFIHFIISFSFFYICDIIYRRFKSRSVIICKGLWDFTPKISFIIICLCFFFLSLPFTLKFYVEFYFFINMFSLNFFVCLILISVLVVFISFVFIRVWFNIIFGIKLNNKFILDINKKEFYIFFFIFIVFLYYSIIFFYFI